MALVEAYCKENALWHEPGVAPEYSQVVELDLGSVEPSLAGPRRPQDRVPLGRAKQSFREALDTFGVVDDDGALAETFPASDPTTEQAPGAAPRARRRRAAHDHPAEGHRVRVEARTATSSRSTTARS